MGALIDASVLIAIERGEVDLEGRLRKIANQDLAIASITASELLHGVHRANENARRARREAWVEALLERLPVLSFDLVAARVHAQLSASLAKRGAVTGAHDLMIGATALSRGLGVITRDEKSFPRMAELGELEVAVW